MNFVNPRNILLASALTLTAFGATSALSDPKKGMDYGKVQGDVTQDTHTQWIEATHCGTQNKKPVNGVASDPEEGGQVAKTADKPQVSDMHVTKHVDASSTKLMQQATSDSTSGSKGCH